MELLNTIKPYLITALVTVIITISVNNLISRKPGQTTDQLQERIAARDSLVMEHLNKVLIKMDSIDARSQRIESLQSKIPEMEAAINLNLRSKEDLSSAERSALRAEIIEYLNNHP